MEAREVPDAELVTALAQGDLAALRQLYDRHAAWLSARLSRRCSDPEVVADALQDTLRRGLEGGRAGAAATARSRPGSGASPSAGWSRGCAPRDRDVVLTARVGLAGDRRRRPEPSPAPRTRCCSASSTATSARRCDASRPELRAVVQATVLDGLTTKEAGRLLGVPENTVKTRLHRAKAQLRGTSQRGDRMERLTSAPTQTWHADGDLLAAYVAGAPTRHRRLGRAAPRSLRRPAARADRRSSTPAPLDRAWDRVRTTVAAPRPGRCPSGCPAPRAPRADALLLAAAPSLRTAWLLGASLALLLRRVAARRSRRRARSRCSCSSRRWCRCPASPLAYGPDVDPMRDDRRWPRRTAARLILLRTLAVLVSRCRSPCAGGAAAARPALGRRSPGWCRPWPAPP